MKGEDSRSRRERLATARNQTMLPMLPVCDARFW